MRLLLFVDLSVCLAVGTITPKIVYAFRRKFWTAGYLTSSSRLHSWIRMLRPGSVN